MSEKFPEPPVFCEHCKHYDRDMHGCSHYIVVAHSELDPIRPNKWGSCYQQNRDNDCEFYEEKFTLAGWLLNILPGGGA